MTVITNVFSQTQIFDIATFIPPAGWQRIDSNGVLLLQNSKTTNGGTNFCQIFLFPSKISSKTPIKNFTAEWAVKVVNPTGTKEKPVLKSEKTPDGWTAVSGQALIKQQGISYSCILVCATGFGRVMSIMINIAGDEYTGDVNKFLQEMELKKAVTPPISSGLLNNYIYTPPEGWLTTTYSDGIVLSSLVSNTGEKCNITLWPLRPAGSNLQNDAVNFFNTVFKTYQTTNSSTPNSMIKGTSAQGWDYFIIKNAIKVAGGDYQTLFGFAFVAKIGNQVAAISGISKDPLVSSCFGLQLKNVWPDFFYSLRLKTPATATGETTLKKKLSGAWMSVTGSSGDRIVFAGNGRYASAAAAQRYYRLSSAKLLTVTDYSFGDGSYALTENSILFTKDLNKNKAEKGWLRIEQESKDGGRIWVEKLYLLRKSIVDSSYYEVCYEKQAN